MRLMATVLILFVVTLVGPLATAEELTRWAVVNPEKGYTGKIAGDPWSEEGAELELGSSSGKLAPYGGIRGRVDGAPFRGKRVIVSSVLGGTEEIGEISVWIRADGANDKLLFNTSARSPVIGGESASYREVGINVPANTLYLVYGVVFTGKGNVEASRFRVRIAAKEDKEDVKASEILEEAISISKLNALNAERINWQLLTTELRESIQADAPAESAYPLIRRLLSALGDGHSSFMDSDAAQRYKSAISTTPVPVVSLVGERFGYVRVPGLRGSDEQMLRKFSDSVSQEIAMLEPKVEGWVVDLRDNDGGNMWPMLEALRQLLGEEPVGGFRYRDGKVQPWTAIARSRRALTKLPDLSSARVAVLTSERTRSAGEAIAVAFRGRPLTRSFGQATAGKSTSNTSYYLADGSMISLTTAVDVDRDGVEYGAEIEPDVAVVDSSRDRDEVLRHAIEWLGSESTR